jgi:hypothetical protein
VEAIPEIGFRFVRWEGIDSASANPASIVTALDSLMITAVFEVIAVDSIPSVISHDTTFTQAHSPYYAHGDVVVDSGTTLRVTAGTQILMPQGSSIVVHGRLLVEGSESSPVVIAPNEHSSSWGALCFVNATDSSVVTHLKIMGATKGPDFDRDRAAISMYNSRLCLQYVSVEKVQMPVFSRYGSIVMKGCNLHSAYPGDLINVKSAKYAVTEDCTLLGCEGYDSDGIDYDGVQAGSVCNNRIFGIYGFNSDAIDLGEGAANILVEGNVIANINDKGVSVGQASTTLIRRNVIANCGMGVAVKDFNSHAQIEQNTFYANHIAVACYEKIQGHGGGAADVVNSILANSSESATHVDNLSRLTVSYSISNTDSLAGLHDMKAHPAFLNNLYLSSNSPAINFGNPLYPTDPDGSLPDAGAFPYDSQKQKTVIVNEIHYHPVEGSEYEFIEIFNPGPNALNVAGFSICGSIQYQFGDVSVAKGEYVVVAKNASVYSGHGYKVFQWTGGPLPDTLGAVQLLDNAGNEIDVVNYSNGSFWPAEADGKGPSMELRQMSLENLVSTSWSSSYASGGTPGASRSSALLTGLFINEFMADNDAVIADEHGDHDDWIEIYNSNTVSLDLGGLYITDNLKTPDKYMIPTNDVAATTVPARGYLLLWADGEVNEGICHLSIKLDKAGEQIGLSRAVEGGGYVYVDSLTFGGQQTNQSYGRSKDGGVTWVVFTKPTPGASNSPLDGVENKDIPMTFALEQNYPNPFNPKTVVSCQLPVASRVKLVVYDILGREVKVLMDEIKDPGRYEVTWDARNCASGVYIYRMTAGGFVSTKKMILLK